MSEQRPTNSDQFSAAILYVLILLFICWSVF